MPNISMAIGMLGAAEGPILIILIWLLLPIMLVWTSEKISLVGLYHELKTETFDGESFKVKIRAICGCNLGLSLPLFAALYTIIDSSIEDIIPVHEIVLALIISLVMLLVLRILANPCDFFVERMCKHYEDDDKNYIIDQYRERVLSFFYSFICAAIILLLIIESHKVMLDEEITELSGTRTDYLWVIFGYSFLVICTTVLGELILKYICKPVRRLPIKKTK